MAIKIMIDKVERIKEIFELLPPSYSHLSSLLRDGEGFKDACYIQHIPDNVELVQKLFLELCHDIGILQNYDPDAKHHRLGIIGRILSDCGDDEIYRAWNRLMCIDEDYREWEQPYYSMNYLKYKDIGISLNNNPVIVQYFRDSKLKDILS